MPNVNDVRQSANHTRVAPEHIFTPRELAVMRTRFPNALAQCTAPAQTELGPLQPLRLAPAYTGTAAEIAALWPALRLKTGRCASWFQRVPIRRRRRATYKGTEGGSCDNGPPHKGPIGRNRGEPGYAYWAKWCAPQGYAHEFWPGGPEEGSIVGARRAVGLFDPFWGTPWTKATADTFDHSRPWFKLPDLPGVWSPPGARPDHTPFTPDPGRVVNEHLHPLLSGALYDKLCKMPNAPIDWCCHQPGNYSYVNFVQDIVTLERYLAAGWKCGPRSTDRSRACQAGWSPAVSLAPPPVTTGTAPARPIIAGTPAAAPGVAAPIASPTHLRCHPPGQPWNYNIVLDTITLERYVRAGWACDAF